MSVITVVIPGQPVGKGRPRFARRGNFTVAYTPAKTETWEGIATTCLRQAWAGRPVLEQAGVTVVAIGERPKRLTRRKDPVGRIWRTAKPDGDNVLKASLDCLTRAGIIRDDKHVVVSRVLSVYAAIGEAPSVEVTITAVTAGPPQQAGGES